MSHRDRSGCRVSRRCRDGARRELLRAALKAVRADGSAWLSWDGQRLRLGAARIPASHDPCVALVRVGRRVFVSAISRRGKSDDGQIVDEVGHVVHPRGVLAEVVEAHARRPPVPPTTRV